MEAIDIPIDLESSLGRLEDIETSESSGMSCAMQLQETSRVRSTCLSASEDEDIAMVDISPYPYSETEVEIRERQKLAAPVFFDFVNALRAELVPNDVDKTGDEDVPGLCDEDLTLSSEDTGSLGEMDSALRRERIEDRAPCLHGKIPRFIFFVRPPAGEG